MTTSLDETRVAAFGEKLVCFYTGGMVTLMVDLASRTGLLDALAAGPGTSEEVAARAGLAERYVRECLGSLVTAGVVEYDPATRRYSLPAEHALLLTGEGSLNMTPLSRFIALLGVHVPAVAQAFRTGGGVPYEAYRPGFTEVMDGLSRGRMDGQLLDGILPLTGELPARLTDGVRVVEVGCGTGHALNLMARAYPRSSFTGYDLAEDAIAQARAEAAAWGLTNVSFEVHDVARLPSDPPSTAVFAFDAIHDQADPVGVLSRVRAALEPGGWFVMMDIKAASALEDNVGNPMAPWLYGISTLHCMTVSLAQGGAGLGTVWGEQLARRMLDEAGFVDVSVHDVPDDPFDSVYVARTPS
jgi:SAM-dependent methyltransferase